VTGILLAAAVGFFVSLLGSPLAIRAFRSWGWGQRIREDGPRGHLEKMGTPTMGGIVILAGTLNPAAILSYLGLAFNWQPSVTVNIILLQPLIVWRGKRSGQVTW